MSTALISVIWKVPAPRVKMLHKTQLSYKKTWQVFVFVIFKGALGIEMLKKLTNF